MIIRTYMTFLVLMLILFFSANAQAGLFLIDLSDLGGSAAGWDVFDSSVTDIGVTDQNSVDNDVTLSIVGFPGGGSIGGESGPIVGVGGGTLVDGISVPSEAWDDYIWGPGPPFDGSILFEFKNLDPGLYNLSVFLGSGGGGQFGTIWAGALGDEPGGQNTGSYVGGSSTLAGLTIGAGDSLFFRHLEDGSGGTSGIIVRQTAAAIPEPSTFVLATLGLLSLGLCGRRRRRR